MGTGVQLGSFVSRDAISDASKVLEGVKKNMSGF